MPPAAPPHPAPKAEAIQRTAPKIMVNAFLLLILFLSFRTPINARPAMGNTPKTSDFNAHSREGPSVEAVELPAVTVSCALAWPAESNVTELGVIEHPGAPAWLGCTLQESATGLLKVLSRLKLNVDVALCPGPTGVGLKVEALIEKSVPELMRTEMVLSVLTATKSGALSLFRSAEITQSGVGPTGKLVAFWNVPSPFPANTKTQPRALMHWLPVERETAMSSLPSPLKSAIATGEPPGTSQPPGGGPKLPSPFPRKVKISPHGARWPNGPQYAFCTTT